jgi:hypothetical protein
MPDLEAITLIRRIVAAADNDRAIGFPDPRRWINTDTVRVLLAEYDRLVAERDGLTFGPRLSKEG